MTDPQRWNRYSYVRNNPLRFVDPTGLYIASCEEDVKNCDREIEKFEKARQKALGINGAIHDAAAAYGALGDDNGVKVSIVKSVGDPKDKKNKRVTGQVKSQDGTNGFRLVGSTIVQATQVSIKARVSALELQATVIHEGVHVQDRKALIDSIDGVNDRWTESLNITARQSEINAFTVENLYWDAIGGAQRDIPAILAKPPYSTNPNIDKPLFPLLVH